ncbi:hypothetical protein EHS25_006363 [Saitozyma podzolica]|uniref:Uncharacterized protein n=1 Tax=Saitozyma podzolica TaxID=1890683 RepID=A0A427YRR9_9TREE|nr:hypothetical protein EHS25_006363 [Saitozyma podzolica]
MENHTKVAVVTGASSGIGRAAAIALNSAGWTVVLSGRRADALAETVQAMPADSRSKTLVVSGDLSSPDDVRNLFASVKTTYGRLDVLFNNAGVPSPKVPIEEMSLDSFNHVIGVNVTAVFQCCQEAIRIMKEQVPRGGRIINNGSVSAHVPRPLSAPYTMSKHAIWGLTKTIALDYRPFNIACSQLDIGNAQSSMSDAKPKGVLQADGSVRSEPVMDARYAGEAVVYMANLPLEVNILNQTIMATNMPFVGRG